MDELYELGDKLQDRMLEVVGFVTEGEPDLREDIRKHLEELREFTEVDIRIFSLWEWIEFYLERTNQQHAREEIATNWIIAYIESLCQRRRDRAPIDEPVDQWVQDWVRLLESLMRKTN